MMRGIIVGGRTIDDVEAVHAVAHEAGVQSRIRNAGPLPHQVSTTTITAGSLTTFGFVDWWKLLSMLRTS